MLEEPKPEYWTHFQPPDTVPVEDGWYPVIRIFDPDEGAFPDCGYWDGQCWTRSCVGLLKKALPDAGEEDLFWVTCEVNSRVIPISIHADSLAHAKVMEPQIRKLVQSVYRKGYMDGFDACGEAIKVALGLD